MTLPFEWGCGLYEAAAHTWAAGNREVNIFHHSVIKQHGS